MFPRGERLRRRKDIAIVLARGRRVSSDSLLLRTLPNRLQKIRVTVVVGTNVSKRAVIRNRVKRQLRHELRELIRGRSLSLDLMVSTRPTILKKTSVERRHELQVALRKAGLLATALVKKNS